MNEESLFAAALEKPTAAERQAFLDEACGGDAALRQRVERLLAADGHTRGILERGPDPTADGRLRRRSRWRPGRVFAGRFKLRQKLGEGGMGEVWVADQTEPVQRRVALKVIRPGLDSARLLARFDQERQALALMDHPNIAKVLDAGVADGRPYFVMELIKGVPITEYCDAARLSPRERLELFVPVCQAVQHAHQKGIIHRDLKPSNILVALYDGKPVPKVIDFGVAKATGPRLTEQSVYTEVGSLIGTLEYMSPEQAELNNLDIDTRSDVYALGVVLYELLTGSVPFSREELQAVGVRRDAADDQGGGAAEAEHAAVRLGDVAERRGGAADRAEEAAGPGPRRAGLDRDEVPGEGPRPAVRDGQRPGRWTCSATWPTSRCWRPAVGGLPAAEVRAAEPGAGRWRPVLVLLALVGGIVGTTVGLVRAAQAGRTRSPPRTPKPAPPHRR